jgi:hypothetical protein
LRMTPGRRSETSSIAALKIFVFPALSTVH